MHTCNPFYLFFNESVLEIASLLCFDDVVKKKMKRNVMLADET